MTTTTTTPTWTSTLDDETRARVERADARRKARESRMSDAERADEERRTAPIANNRGFSLFKS